MNRENFHQSLAAANIFCCIFLTGTHMGWVSPAIVKLKSGEDGLTASNEQISWIATIPEIGRFFGPLIPAIFLDIIGRKPIVMICSFSLFLSWLIMALARSITVIYLVKLLVGITQGVVDATSGIYLAENCTPKMRGILSGIIPLCYCTSYLLEYVLLAYGSFAFVAIVNAMFGFASFLTCVFLKETPYYLAMKGRTEAAKRNLLWLRGRNIVDSDIKHEMDQIQQNMQLEILKKRSIVSLFGSPENYQSLILAAVFSFLIPMVGANIIIAYSTMIFQASSVFSAKEFTILYGVSQIIVAFISPFLIERYNRRTLLLNLLGVMGAFQVLIYFIYWMRMHEYIANECFSWVIFTTVTIISSIFFFGYPLMVIIRSEFLPMSVRAIGGSLNIMTSSIGASLCLRLFLPITEAIGIQYNFVIEFIFCVLEFILVLTVLPETRGKTLVDIQMSFRASK